MHTTHPTRRGRGFTLIEVLVTLLVLSIGLLGIAKLLLVSSRANDSAYLAYPGYGARLLHPGLHAGEPAGGRGRQLQRLSRRRHEPRYPMPRQLALQHRDDRAIRHAWNWQQALTAGLGLGRRHRRDGQ